MVYAGTARFRLINESSYPEDRFCQLMSGNIWQNMFLLYSSTFPSKNCWYLSTFLEPLNDEGKIMIVENAILKSPNKLNYSAIFNKLGWPAGLWMYEPDMIDWYFKGKLCQMRRGYDGSWSGYVHFDPQGSLKGLALVRLKLIFSVHNGISILSDNAIGFSCNSSADFSPSPWAMGPNRGIYRDVKFVRYQVENLADMVVKYEANRK